MERMLAQRADSRFGKHLPPLWFLFSQKPPFFPRVNLATAFPHVPRRPKF